MTELTEVRLPPEPGGRIPPTDAVERSFAVLFQDALAASRFRRETVDAREKMVQKEAWAFTREVSVASRAHADVRRRRFAFVQQVVAYPRVVRVEKGVGPYGGLKLPVG